MGIIEKIKSLLVGEENESITQSNPQNDVNDQKHLQSDLEASYEDVPEYIPINMKDYPIVSVITSAIASEGNLNTEFSVKSIKMKNPEFMKVAIISSCLASTYYQELNLNIKKIQKVRELNA